MANDTRAHQPRRRFGQNFLHDRGIIDHIVDAIRPTGSDRLLEIGPGQGALTEPLLAAAQGLHVVEVDRDLCVRLRQRFGAHPGFVLHEGDALAFDFDAHWRHDPGRRLRVAGNLPYNISTPIIFHLLAHRHAVQDMHFMLQQEVVARLTATPGSKAYGRLSVMVQLDCRADALFTVRPGAFHPAPKVTSAVVRLTVLDAPATAITDRAVLARLVRHLFSQRRKTLRASLKGQLSEIQIRSLGVDPQARPETLSLAAFGALANFLAGQQAGVEAD